MLSLLIISLLCMCSWYSSHGACALQDIRDRGRPGGHLTRLDTQPSLIAPRTMSELERSLCRSSSFMREVMAAGLSGIVPPDSPVGAGWASPRATAGGGGLPSSRFSRLSAGQAGAATEASKLRHEMPPMGDQSEDTSLLGRPSEHLVDASPFLAEPGNDLPGASVSAIMADFDWNSFNASFALPGPDDDIAMADAQGAAASQRTAAVAGGSAWARVCKEADVRLSSKSDLGPRPPMDWVPQ